MATVHLQEQQELKSVGLSIPDKDNVEESKKSLRLLDAKKMKDRLNVVSMPNWMKCIDESLRKSNVTRAEFF